jgi:hypothetical protein
MAETEPDNAASQRVLEKLGFTPAGEGREGPRFEMEKPKTSWISIYMCLGLSVGLSLGAAMKNMGTAMSIGLCIGLALGVALDEQDKKKRAELRAARESEQNRPE